MKGFLLAAAVICFATSAIADGHGNKILFELRHESTPMEVTSVHLNSGGERSQRKDKWAHTAEPTLPIS